MDIAEIHEFFKAFIFLAAVFLAFPVLYSMDLMRRRRKALERFAEARGFVSIPQADSFRAGAEGWMNCYLFLAQGWRRWFTNVLKGKVEGRQWVVFDFHLRSLYRRVGFLQRKDFTGAAIELQGKKCPSFALFHRTSAVPTMFLSAPEAIHFPRELFPRDKDINFGDPSFEVKYSVQGQDEIAIKRLFGPDLRRALLEDARTWYIEGSGDWLLIYYFSPFMGNPHTPEKDIEDIGAVVGMLDKALLS